MRTRKNLFLQMQSDYNLFVNNRICILFTRTLHVVLGGMFEALRLITLFFQSVAYHFISFCIRFEKLNLFQQYNIILYTIQNTLSSTVTCCIIQHSGSLIPNFEVCLMNVRYAACTNELMYQPHAKLQANCIQRESISKAR